MALYHSLTYPLMPYFRLLMLLYLLPFFFGVVTILYTVIKLYTQVNESPLYLSIGQIGLLSLLSITSVISDYIAVHNYMDVTDVTKLGTLMILRVPFIVMLKMTLGQFMTHGLSAVVLNRYFQWKSLWYFVIQLLGLFIYEFTVLTTSTTTIQGKVEQELSDLKIIQPLFYSVDTTALKISSTFKWLPFIMILVSSLCNALTIILTKKYLLYQAYKKRMLMYQDQKMKLKDCQLNLTHLNENMLLKPRLVNKNSMLNKRHQYLYGRKMKRNYVTTKFYKKFKTSKLKPKLYRKVFIKDKMVKDPVTQAYIDYRKDVILNTEEDEKLELLQTQREQELGIKHSEQSKLNQTGITLQSKLQDLHTKALDYIDFRQYLQQHRKKMKKLNSLQEMANDANYLMFQQHLFCEFNELEASQLDTWFNSPAMDLLSLDYTHTIGLTWDHTLKLVSAMQFTLMFPLLIIIEKLAFNSHETWTTFYYAPWEELIKQVSWEVLVFVIAISILIILRPIVQHTAITCLPISTQSNLFIASMFTMLVLDQAITYHTILLPITQLIGFSIVIFAHNAMLHYLEDDMRERQVAQTIELVKTVLEPEKKVEAKKIENQLVYIYHNLGIESFNQAVQDALLMKSGKALSYLAPSVLPQRKLFDPNYHRVLSEWGGGYPRPQYEIISSKWNIDIGQKVHPSLFTAINPDINMSDLLFEKTGDNEFKRQHIMLEMRKFAAKKRQLEMTQQFMISKVNPQSKPVMQMQPPQKTTMGIFQAQPSVQKPLQQTSVLNSQQQQQQKMGALNKDLMIVQTPKAPIIPQQQPLPKQRTQQQSQKTMEQQAMQAQIKHQLQQLPAVQDPQRKSIIDMIFSKREDAYRVDQYKQQQQMSKLLEKVDNPFMTKKRKQRIYEVHNVFQKDTMDSSSNINPALFDENSKTKVNPHQQVLVQEPSSWLSIKAKVKTQSKRELDFAYKSDSDTEDSKLQLVGRVQK